MKVVIEFDVPDEQYDVWCCHNSKRAFSAIDDIRMALRNHFKYDVTPEKTIQHIDETLKDLYNVTGDPLEQ